MVDCEFLEGMYKRELDVRTMVKKKYERISYS